MAFLRLSVYGSTPSSSMPQISTRTRLSVRGVSLALLLFWTFITQAGNAYAQEATPTCPGAVSGLTIGGRPDLALKFIDEIRKAGESVATVCGSERLAALSAVAVAKSGGDEACKVAADLTERIHPAAALDLIGLIRGPAESPEDPLTIFTSCEKERRQALAALSSPPLAAASQQICDAVTALTAAGRPTAALTLVETMRGPSEGRTIQESGLCETERFAALKDQAEAEGGSNPAEKLGQNWDVLVRDWVTPLQGAGLLSLGLILALLVLARLFAFMPGMPINRLEWKSGSTTWRRLTLVLGTVLILLSSGITVMRLSEAPFDVDRLAVAGGALILGVLGSFLLGIFIASRLRLRIEVRTPDGKRSDWAEARIVASLREMGSEPSREIEVPRGIDVAGLDDAAVTIPFTNKFLNGIQNVVKSIAGVTPWHVAVDVKNDDILAFSITRNGWAVTSGTVTREQLGVVKVAGTDQSPDLFKMISAAIVATLAPHYQGFEGLCGATDWRSIGLHCLATMDYSASPPQAASLLGRAVTLDPKNVAAQIAQQYYLHRDATREDELKLYADWLYLTVSRLGKPGLSGCESLILRTKVTYLACVMNLNARPVDHVNQADRKEMREIAKDMAKSLLDSLENARDEYKLLALEMLPVAALAYIDLMHPDIVYSDLPKSETGYEHYKAAVLASTAPKVAYNAACSLAMREGVEKPDESEVSRLQSAADWDSQRIPWIKERLVCAFTDPELRTWALKDPEFDRIRLHPDLKSLLSPSDEESHGPWKKWAAQTLTFLSSFKAVS